MYRFTVLFVLCLTALVALAWADTGPTATRFDPSQMILSPSSQHRAPSSLDSARADTIRYDDGSISSFYSAANYWGRVKFTAPDSFTVQSIYFVANNPNANASPCSLYVYSSNAGNLGTVLAHYRVSGAVVHFGTSLTNPTWNDTDLPIPVQIAAGQDFFVVIGPQPGGVQTAGWHFLLDGSATPGRSGVSASRTGTYATTGGDILLRVGGHARQYVDLAADECYNQTTAGPKFFTLAGTPLTFKGQIRNNGNMTVDLFTVDWTVHAPGGSVVFTNQVTGGPLTRNQIGQYTASADFTPTANGEYMISCVCHADNDAVATNDTTWLRMYVGPQHRWFRYDDNGDAEGYTSFVPNSGWGLTFAPVTYTALVESVRVNAGGTGTGDVEIWLNNPSTGIPDTMIWGDTPNLALGWVSIPVSPPVQVYAGQSFTIAYVYTSVSLGADQNLPNEAAITHMGNIAWQFQQGSFTPDNAGNWCLQAYVDTSSALPPYPVIAANVDTLAFGQVDTTAHTNVVQTLRLYNHGGGNPLHVTAMSFNPISIRAAYTANPTTATIAAGDSADITVTFDPGSVRLYNGWLVLTNDSHNNTADTIVVRGEGVRAAAAGNHESDLPTHFALAQNYPNPFNPTTDIQFSLPVQSQVRLAVYDVLGQEVATLVNSTMPAGIHTAMFDATKLPSGIYFCRLQAGSFSDIRKMMLMK